jgi:hypothetical protein
MATNTTRAHLAAHITYVARARLKRDGTRAETRFRLSTKRTSPFKSAGESVQSTTGSREVRISGQTMDRPCSELQCNSSGYPIQSPISPLLPLPRVTVCHHYFKKMALVHGYQHHACAFSSTHNGRHTLTSSRIFCHVQYLTIQYKVNVNLDILMFLWRFIIQRPSEIFWLLESNDKPPKNKIRPICTLRSVVKFREEFSGSYWWLLQPLLVTYCVVQLIACPVHTAHLPAVPRLVFVRVDPEMLCSTLHM